MSNPASVINSRYEQMIEEATFLVVLNRRNNDLGEPLYGVHAIHRRPLADRDTYGEFSSRTLGLFSLPMMEGLTQYAGDVQHFAHYHLIEVENPALIDYIGGQVIPIEWQRQYREQDPLIFSRIDVWA